MSWSSSRISKSESRNQENIPVTPMRAIDLHLHLHLRTGYHRVFFFFERISSDKKPK